MEAQPADEEEEGHAADAGGAAGGAADGVFELAQGVGGGEGGQGFQQPVPEAGMGEAAEEAGDGLGVAVVGGQVLPGFAGGVGEMEDGVHAGAEIGRAAALGGAGEDVGREGVPLEVGEGGVGAGWGETRHKRLLCERRQENRGLFSFCQGLCCVAWHLTRQ